MGRTSVLNLVLFAYVALVFVVAAWASGRTHHAADYVVANRRLEMWLTAFGYVGSATNAWMLTLVAAAAFTWGLSAIWLWASFIFGALLSMGYVAPRLRTVAAGQAAATMTQVISTDAGDRLQPLIARSAAFIALIFLLLQIAVVARAAAELLNMDSGFDPASTVMLGIAVIAICVLAGGLRAASVFDAVQTSAMLCIASLLPIGGLVAIGSSDALISGLTALGPGTSDWFGGKSGVVAIALAMGALALGFAIPGQPHAMARLIAVRDEVALRRARWIAFSITIVLLAAVVICGWCARLLYDGLEHPEHAMYALATRLLPPAVAAFLIATMFAALMMSIASPMLALASQLAVDLRRTSAQLSMPLTRAVLVGVSVLGILAASFMPLRLLDHALVAFTALGAAFGPLLLVRLSGKRIRPGSILGAMWAGFILTVLFHLLPDSPGDFLERVLPFLAAFGIALTGGERRRNPDRADRSQETVHDRIPR
jgi:sodium/proline symporter